MARARVLQHAFNVGVQDKSALTRIDLERMRLAAEEQTNLLCKVTGAGFMRPGLEYLSSTASDAQTLLKEFVFGATDAALLEFSNQALRVRVADQLITRAAVSSSVTNGDFPSATGWTLTATSGASSTVSSGFLALAATARGSSAKGTQAVSVALADRGVEHALRIIVERGPVTFYVGSSSGADDYVSETILRTGTHSIAFTPTGANFYIEFKSELRSLKLVDYVQVESAGVMSLPTPWTTANLGKIRTAQSADVVFVAAAGYWQRRIERRSTRSWSVVFYYADDGPFTADRTRAVKLKSSVTEGNGTLTASSKFFNSNHVGAIFRLFNAGVNRSVKIGAENTYTDPFRVTGVYDAVPAKYNDRNWSYVISGTWVGTIRIKRSFDSKETGYLDYVLSYPGNTATGTTINMGATSNQDLDQNAIVYYKIGFDPGEYSSGNATIQILYDGGGEYGTCRVTGYTSSTVVDIEVLSPFSTTEYTDQWQEGEWSANYIYPSAVELFDGRLWWSGEDRIWGSVSDSFESFDDQIDGDAGPISRSIATGGVNETQWLLGLQRLLIGTEGSIATVKSSSLDEPLTPTNLTIKDASTTGVAAVEAVRVDSRALCVERAGKAITEVVYSSDSGEYVATQLSRLTTDVFGSGVYQIGVQRRPDTRIWAVLTDGSCVCAVYEPDQQVLAFVPIETDGLFESVAVLPAADQDRVYFVVNRTINGSTVRFVEKMALDSEVKPQTLCKVMDAFELVTNAPASTAVSGLTHLVGETVVAWADGAPVEASSGVRSEFTVSGSGTITLPAAASNIVVGLPYRSRYKSARMAYGAAGGTALLKKQAIASLGLLLTDFTRAGVKTGESFDNLYPMPAKVGGATPDAIVLSDVHGEEPYPFGGAWTTDARVHIEINSPYTATVLGMVLEMDSAG